jgi:apolipoprotein N-acyltransferase
VTVAAPTREVAASFPVRVAVGVAAAGLMAVAFPPIDLVAGWAGVPAFAGLVWAFRGLARGRAALLGLGAGMVFFLILLNWMLVLGPDAWVLLALLCASFWAGAGAMLPGLLARRWWVLTVPLLWVVQEALRGRLPWGGFPWGRLAFSQADTALVGWAALGGPALVTFAVALAGTTLLAAWDALRSGRPRTALVAVAVIGGLVLGGALTRGAGWGGPDGRIEQVAIVQGNVPRLGLDFNAQRRAVLDNHVRATQELALEVAAGQQAQPVAVIWPENSSDIDPLRNADAGQQIDLAADAIGAPILVGGVVVNPADPPRDDDPGTILNVSLVWDPATGPGEAYVKRHPVPFGEYLPFRDILSRFITRFDRIPRDFAAGDEVGFLTIGALPAGIAICFEIAYDDLVRDAVRAGGQVVVVQTNNATYGGTGQPEQQLAITRVQAVASGRTSLVAATSGISAVIGPDGRISWQTAEFTADSTVTAVPLRSGLTPAMRVGGLPELVALLALVGLALAGGRGRRRAARAAGRVTAR